MSRDGKFHKVREKRDGLNREEQNFYQTQREIYGFIVIAEYLDFTSSHDSRRWDDGEHVNSRGGGPLEHRVSVGLMRSSWITRKLHQR